jgi:penicillin-binding protein 1A
MGFSKHQRRAVEILLGGAVLLALILGIGLGLALAETRNIQIRQKLGEYKPAIPSQILDRNGALITEFFAEEKREIVPVEELPKTLIYALIAREDKNFFKHKGFDLGGLIRAAWNIVTGQFFSGGSTLTQQIAGYLYADRKDISIKRKLKELWWAFQMERNLTKYEILELYVNTVYFGHNTYGVESASQFYFGHSARELTAAESAILVVQLASPTKYSPINHPNAAKERQREILDLMVANNYITADEAEQSFQEYWNSYDFTRSNIASAYFANESRAPYFSEYVRLQLEEMLLGSLININEEGFIVHTTLDLSYQQAAEEILSRGLAKANSTYQSNSQQRLGYTNTAFVPIIDLLSLAFNIEDISVAGTTHKKNALKYYQRHINPVESLVSFMMGSDEITFVSSMAFNKAREEVVKTTVEGALITIENDTGYILAMIGGSEFKTKKFNRAVDAYVQPVPPSNLCTMLRLSPHGNSPRPPCCAIPPSSSTTKTAGLHTLPRIS